MEELKCFNSNKSFNLQLQPLPLQKLSFDSTECETLSNINSGNTLTKITQEELHEDISYMMMQNYDLSSPKSIEFGDQGTEMKFLSD